jgi:hypothetical protein
MGWIGEDRWRDHVNAVMNRNMLVNYRVASQLVASRVVLGSIVQVMGSLSVYATSLS